MWKLILEERWKPDGTKAEAWDRRIREVSITREELSATGVRYFVQGMHEHMSQAQRFGPYSSEDQARAKAAELTVQLRGEITKETWLK